MGREEDEEERVSEILLLTCVAEQVQQNLHRLIGFEAFSEIETQLRSSVSVHVYRASDIPNRHG
jgi:hypothetical protein